MKISKKRSLKWVLSIFVLIYIFNVIRTAISLFCNKAFQRLSYLMLFLTFQNQWNS